MWNSIDAWHAPYIAVFTALGFAILRAFGFSEADAVSLSAIVVIAAILASAYTITLIDGEHTAENIDGQANKLSSISAMLLSITIYIAGPVMLRQDTVPQAVGAFGVLLVVYLIVQSLADTSQSWFLRKNLSIAGLMPALFIEHIGERAVAVALLLLVLCVQFLWTTWHWRWPNIPYIQPRVSE